MEMNIAGDDDRNLWTWWGIIIFVKKRKKKKKNTHSGVVAGTDAAGVGVVAIEGLLPAGELLTGFPDGFFDLGAFSCCCCCFCCCLHFARRFLNHTYFFLLGNKNLILSFEFKSLILFFFLRRFFLLLGSKNLISNFEFKESKNWL